jgi:Flp pilus assembly protein TadG
VPTLPKSKPTSESVPLQETLHGRKWDSVRRPQSGTPLNRCAGCADKPYVHTGNDNKRLQRLWRGATRGTSVVEFALIAPTVFLLLFAVFDFARLFYVETTLQNAVRVAGRYGATGNHLPDPQHQGQTLSRVNSMIQIAQQAAMGISTSNIQISSVGGGSGSAGGPGDTLTVSLTTNLQLITPIVGKFFNNGTYTFTVSVSFKNEPFSPSNTS